ncbi:MAG TPA: zinc ribbon domain-containing protein [Gemmatimonadaceae bacterium]|nr:zinc ribbon domain-containing protein [Gemmatimonadaceae bacterium]HRQ78049.1 zinc ribbon domain-containing protein [Gemmatimonadaceae bacterium]
MPTYEYRCPEGHESEDFVLKISDAKPEIPCPTCGAVASRRMSAGSGLLFKGSGFYITDYGKDGKKDLREKQKAAGTKGAEGTGTASSGGATAPAASAAAAATAPTTSASPASGSSSKGGSGTSSAS